MSHPLVLSAVGQPTQKLPDEFKEEQTVSSIRRKIRRSRSRNSSDEDGRSSNRRFRESQLDPSHTYIRQIPVQAELSQSMRSHSPKLTERKLGQPTVTQSATAHNLRKESQQPAQQHYRRPLTPHKTQRQVEGCNTKLSNGRSREEQRLQAQLTQKDMELAECQVELDRLRMERENLRRVALASEKEKIKLINDKNRMESRNTILQQQLQQKCRKLYELETAMLENESSLAEAKTSLEKLRKLIKENRMAELQAQNKRFQTEIVELRQINIRLKVDLETMNERLTASSQQADELKNKIGKLQAQTFTKQKSYHIESMKEQYLNREIAVLKNRLEEGRTRHQIQLEQLVHTLKQQLIEAHTHTKCLDIKLNCLARRQLQAKQLLKKQTSTEYLQLKDRFRKFLQQYQKFRKQHNQLKVSYAMLSRRKSAQCDSTQLSFELTPEK